MKNSEIELIDNILNYKVPNISPDIHFWMIRAQQGYFYNEFITEKYVALAWNLITCSTSFTDENKKLLVPEIQKYYPNIRNTSTLINKCEKFITKISVGDIIVIPSSRGDSYTFVKAGEYYEVPDLTIEDEINTLVKLDKDKTGIKCPYKKRRRIAIIKTVPRSYLTPIFQKAISSYHGLSNLDEYAIDILSVLYNCFVYKDTFALVYNVRKQTPIKPSELMKLMYGCTTILSYAIDEEGLSTKLSLNSPGPVEFLANTFHIIKDNWYIIAGLLVVLTGGKFFNFELNGILPFIKSIFTIKQDKRLKELEVEEKEIEVINKKMELFEKVKSIDIEPEALSEPICKFLESVKSMEIEPITLPEEVDSGVSLPNIESACTNEEQPK